MLLALALIVQNTSSEVAQYLSAHRAADRALIAGRAADAKTSFETCLALAPENATVAYGLACAHAKSGETERALDWLERAVSTGYVDAAVATWDRDLDSVRKEPRFERALERMRARHPGEFVQYLVRTFDTRASPFIDVDIDARARVVAVGRANGELAMLDPRTGELRSRSKPIAGELWNIELAPTADFVIALTHEGAVYSWAPGHEPKLLATLEGALPTTRFCSGSLLEFDPSGARLLAVADKRKTLLLRASGEPIRPFDGEFANFLGTRIAWNHDGTRIASWNAEVVQFRDGTTGESRPEKLTTPSNVMSVAFDGQGRWIATGHEDGFTRLWDATSFALIGASEKLDLDFFGGATHVAELRFSPAGDRLAATTTSGVHICVFDVPSLVLVTSSGFLGGRMGEPADLCWSADGRRVWSSFVTGAMQVNALEVPARGERAPKVDMHEARASWITRGRTPSSSATGPAVFTNFNSVTMLDGATGAVRWSRVKTDRGHMFQTHDGWFDADFDDLAEITVYRPLISQDPGTPLTDLSIRCFDPKRVRAMRDGVPLARMTW